VTRAYAKFLAEKRLVVERAGFDPPEQLSTPLFPFQADLVRWALRRGRAAIFAGTGLGKTRMQLTWSSYVAGHTGGRVLILAPLAVSQQTVREGAAIGVEVRAVQSQAGVGPPGIYITNYDRFDGFDCSKFDGVVLDESSILKAHDGKTRTALIDSWGSSSFRLACSATPAPNDHEELGNHAEFLGVMRRTEMLSMFFAHDGGDTAEWALRGHAQRAFWRWVAEWAALVRRPSDLGYDDGAYNLPPLTINDHVVRASVEQARASGMLVAMAARGLSEQRNARRATMPERVRIAADLVNAHDQQCIVWAELNAEADALEKAIPGAVQVAGADTREHKEKQALDFAEGRLRVLISKPSVFGYGMNWQSCNRVVFVGVSHSFEQFYQAVRRCWRFGQTRPVICDLITSELEGEVLQNLRRKEADAEAMAEQMSIHTRSVVRDNVRGTVRQTIAYEPKKTMAVPAWLSEGGAE